jgi:hypothetical protein
MTLERGHVDEDVEASELADGLVDDALSFVWLREVGLEHCGPTPQCPHGGARLLGFGQRLAIDERDVSAVSSQLGRDHGAYALATCYQCDAIGKVHRASVYCPHTSGLQSRDAKTFSCGVSAGRSDRLYLVEPETCDLVRFVLCFTP